MDTLVLFLILEERYSAFHHWVAVHLSILFLLCWGTFLLCPNCWDFLSWKNVEFFQFWGIYWDDHMIFLFHFVNMLCHIYWFTYVEAFLHPSGKFHLVRVYDFLMCCWVQFANIWLRKFISVFIRDVVNFLFLSLSAFGIRIMLAS